MTNAQGNRGWTAAAAAAAVLTMLTLTKPASGQHDFHTVASFDSTDGAYPTAPLIQGFDGNLYGTTFYGGPRVSGTIFKITPQGVLTSLYRFCSQANCSDGANPYGGLLQAADGELYGMTETGGASGLGTIFRISRSGTLSTLHSFCEEKGCPDGASPTAGLIEAANGEFYGTTTGGGANLNGTVFELSPDGTVTTLYSFCSRSECADGAIPISTLVQAPDGDFYGTTYDGGAHGIGTVFKISASGALTTLHSFSGSDGTQPWSGLVQASNGNFYGTTVAGGLYGYGTVYEIGPGDSFTSLYSFCPATSCPDGAYPYAALIQASDGNLYGATEKGGLYQAGAVFRVSVDGALTTLHRFDISDGAAPLAALVQDSNGDLYGTASAGGSGVNCFDKCGTIYTLGLGPSVETQPDFGSQEDR